MENVVFADIMDHKTKVFLKTVQKSFVAYKFFFKVWFKDKTEV